MYLFAVHALYLSAYVSACSSRPFICSPSHFCLPQFALRRLNFYPVVQSSNYYDRFKDAVLFYEFRTKATTWSKAAEMDLDSAKALAMRINMEIDVSKTWTQASNPDLKSVPNLYNRSCVSYAN